MGLLGVAVFLQHPAAPPFCADIAPCPVPLCAPGLCERCPGSAPRSSAQLRAHPRSRAGSGALLSALKGKGAKMRFSPPPAPLPPGDEGGGSNPRRWCGGCAGAVLPGDAQPPAPSGKLRCQARPRSGRQYRSPNGSIIRC